jgi:S1-C subfamily serine protease
MSMAFRILAMVALFLPRVLLAQGSCPNTQARELGIRSDVAVQSTRVPAGQVRATNPLGFTIATPMNVSGTVGGARPEGPVGYPVVTSVVKGSAAEAAGLAVCDLILAIDERDGRARGPLFPNAEPGTVYRLTVRRGGEELELKYVYASGGGLGAQAR